MIKLLEFWEISKAPLYYLATGDRLSVDEIMEHREDEVLHFAPINVMDPGDFCSTGIGVVLGDKYMAAKVKLSSAYGKMATNISNDTP